MQQNTPPNIQGNSQQNGQPQNNPQQNNIPAFAAPLPSFQLHALNFVANFANQAGGQGDTITVQPGSSLQEMQQAARAQLASLGLQTPTQNVPAAGQVQPPVTTSSVPAAGQEFAPTSNNNNRNNPRR